MEIKSVKKYFMRCGTNSGSLAIEKHLYGYIWEHFAEHLVEEDAIGCIVKNIENEQDRYFKEHRGQKVEIFFHGRTWGEIKFIQAGQMHIALIPVKGSYVKED